jgi:hypothetical protein
LSRLLLDLRLVLGLSRGVQRSANKKSSDH